MDRTTSDIAILPSVVTAPTAGGRSESRLGRTSVAGGRLRALAIAASYDKMSARLRAEVAPAPSVVRR
jgi:hypothetical protein